MSDIKVSIIIPVYNVETYLRECLDSVINQTLKEIEIICIDDCSTDNSYKILEEYAKNDNRIILLKNDNNVGVAISRNKGINISKGEFIGFVDSDDYITLDFFECLYKTAVKYNSDITYTLNIYRKENDKIYMYRHNVNNFISKKEKNDLSYIEGESNISITDEKNHTKEYTFVVIWNKIFKKTFLINNDLFFMPIKARWGDTDFYYRFMINKPKTSYNHKPIYYYRVNNKSIVESSRGKTELNITAIQHLYNSLNYYKYKKADILSLKYISIKLWSDIMALYTQSQSDTLFYTHLYKFANSINLDKEVFQEYINKNKYCDKNIFNEYIFIKSNDTYEKYLLQKELFEQIKLLDYKINKIIDKQNSKIKLFGIDNLKDRKIIYIFGIKITIKK